MADGSASITAERAAKEVLRRRAARKSLVAYSKSVAIPGVPISEDESEWVFKPIESDVARHHVVTMEAIQRCIETDGGRLIILEPPGSAKSTYASVVAPAWAMARRSNYRVILTSYAATPAERQSRRCRALVSSPEAVAIWNDRPTLRAGSSAVTEWELSNDSGMLAAGILGAITSARADLLIIDDPVANREEADSETIRRKILQEYQDSLLTRLKPRGSVIIIQTRWHMDDLAGSILPEDYAGESGPVKCRDGNTWDVLNIPAKCEREDDPVGRKIGEYLWPEWFDAAHWRNYESNPRTWSSLYQQRPQPDSGGQFEREWFQWYDEDEIPERLKYYGASDFAVTEKALKTNPDYSEHGIFGLDDEGDIWVLDWYFGQEAPDETLKEFVALVKQWRPRQWFDEGGVIRRAIEPLKKLIMRAAGVYIAVEYLPSTQDKIARVASFRGRASAGCVHLPRNKPWAKRLLAQLCSFPFARYDDAVDVCGNFGRGLDQMSNAKKPEAERDHIIKPFTRRHIENKGWDREEEDTRAFYR